MSTDRRWLWFCSIPFWALLAGAVAVAVLEDPSLVRFTATVAGGAAMSGALVGLLAFVGWSNRRARARSGTDARQAQIRAWAVIAGLAAVVAIGAGIAALGGVEGAIVLLVTALAALVGALIGIWRRATARA